MLGAGTRYSAIADLAAIGDELTKGSDVLIINIRDFLLAERAWLLLKFL